LFQQIYGTSTVLPSATIASKVVLSVNVQLTLVLHLPQFQLHSSVSSEIALFSRATTPRTQLSRDRQA
jgi:hypothetical protein